MKREINTYIKVRKDLIPEEKYGRKFLQMKWRDI